MSATLRCITLTACVFGQSAFALPTVQRLDGAFAPAQLTAEQVIEGGSITLSLSGGRAVTVAGVPTSPAAGMIGLAARSPGSAVRLYAFVADGQLQSADVYGRFGHERLVRFKNSAYWVPAQATLSGALRGLAEPVLPGTSSLAKTAAVEAPDADGSYGIRLLALYTPLFIERVGGAREAEIAAQRLVFLTNAYMETNHVPVTFELAGGGEFDGADETQDFYANIDAMVGNSRVASLRNSSASDLVVLLRTEDGADLCGLSSGFNGMERSDPPENVDPERDAFNVVAAAPLADGSTSCGDDPFPHELGHSLAGGHDYATSLGFEYWKPYSHAMACTGGDGDGEVRYFSLMWGTGVGPGGGRSDVITNPDAIFDGVVCGAEGVDGVDASQANNVRAMTEAAPYVAAYRKSGSTSDGTTSGGTGGGGGTFGGGLLPLLALFTLRRRAARTQNRQAD